MNKLQRKTLTQARDCAHAPRRPKVIWRQLKPISAERPRFGMPGQLCRLLDPKDHVAHTSRKHRPARNRKRVLIYAGWDYLILYVRSPSAA
jgi:hypothetical protein